MKQGKLICNTQTAHVLTLYFNLCDDKEKIAKNLADLIQENGNKLSTGFIGTPYLLYALSDNGYEELAYSLLLREEAPSWLYAVNMGATTVWQRWNSTQPDTVMPNMDLNSYNHCAGGAVADWMYSVMGGIQIDEKKPGFQHIILKPVIDKRISFVNASIEIKTGTVSSSWRRDNGKVIYNFEVPPHSCATIVLGNQEYKVEPGKYSYKI